MSIHPTRYLKKNLKLQVQSTIYTVRRSFEGVRYLPKCIFPRVTSQVSITQVTTSQKVQFPKRQLPKV